MKKNLFFLLTIIIYYQHAMSQCAPVLVYDSNNVLCEGNTVNFTVTPTLAAGCQVATNTPTPYELVPPAGNSFALPSPQNQWQISAVDLGVYKARVKIEDDGSGTCPCVGYSPESNLIVINEVPDSPSVVIAQNPVLCGEAATLTANSVTNGTFIWKDAQNNFLFTGHTFVTQPLNAPTIFYVYEKLGECESNPQAVTINTSSLTPPTFLNPNSEICKGESMTLVVNNTGANQVVRWYSDAGRNTLLGLGSVYQTPPLTYTTIFYADISQGNCYSNLIADTVKVNDLVSPIVSNTQTFCKGTDVILTHIPIQSNFTVNWYSDISATQLIQTGTTLHTSILYNDTTFFIAYTKGNCKSLPSATILIPTIPVGPSISDTSVCKGESLLLSLSNAQNVTVRWYGDGLGTQMLSQGNSFITPSIWNDMHYWVNIDSLGCQSHLTPFNIQAVDLASVVFPADSPVICYNTATLLEANASTGSDIYWWDMMIGGDLLHVGHNFQTTAITENFKTYWAEARQGNCVSPRKPITVKLNSLPIAYIDNTNSPVCEHDRLCLSANKPNVTYYWTGPNGWKDIGQNPCIDNVLLEHHQGTYYLVVEDTFTHCKSNPVETIVRIMPLPAIGLSEQVMTTENVPLQLNATGGNTYNWFPNTYLNDIKSATPIFLLPTDRVSLPATFSYMVTVQNDFCTNKDTINVYVEAGKVTVYNFISPNNDGANDSWIIENEEEEWGTDYRIRIMDQNNVLVYLHEGKYEDDWKATDKYGKTLPDGTSYWYIIDNTSNHQEIRGTLNVLSNQ